MIAEYVGKRDLGTNLYSGDFGADVVMLRRLRLRGNGEVREVALGALGVGPDEVRIFGVEKRERLRTGAIRVHAHPVPFTLQRVTFCLSC